MIGRNEPYEPTAEELQLKDHVTKILNERGILESIKNQLRNAVADVIENSSSSNRNIQSTKHNKNDVVKDDSNELMNSKVYNSWGQFGPIILALICDVFQCLDLTMTIHSLEKQFTQKFSANNSGISSILSNFYNDMKMATLLSSDTRFEGRDKKFPLLYTLLTQIMHKNPMRFNEVVEESLNTTEDSILGKHQHAGEAFIDNQNNNKLMRKDNEEDVKDEIKRNSEADENDEEKKEKDAEDFRNETQSKVIADKNDENEERDTESENRDEDEIIEEDVIDEFDDQILSASSDGEDNTKRSNYEESMSEANFAYTDEKIHLESKDAYLSCSKTERYDLKSDDDHLEKSMTLFQEYKSDISLPPPVPASIPNLPCSIPNIETDNMNRLHIGIYDHTQHMDVNDEHSNTEDEFAQLLSLDAKLREMEADDDTGVLQKLKLALHTEISQNDDEGDENEICKQSPTLLNEDGDENKRDKQLTTKVNEDDGDDKDDKDDGGDYGSDFEDEEDKFAMSDEIDEDMEEEIDEKDGNISDTEYDHLQSNFLDTLLMYDKIVDSEFALNSYDYIEDIEVD